MIAISYRRDDSLAITGRLYDRLRVEFGKENVFMDLDSIAAGADFREQIRETIGKAGVLIAVIGPKWLGPRADSSHRINDEGDVVRLEIASALAQQIPIIPVLVNNTTMPQAAMLPPDVQDLAFRNALPLDSGMDFHLHVERLIRSIRRFVRQTDQPPASSGQSRLMQPRRKTAMVWAAMFGAVIVGLGIWLMRAKSPQANQIVSSSPVRQASPAETSPAFTPSPGGSATRSAQPMSRPLDMALTAPPANSNQWSAPVSIPAGIQCYWETERDRRGERKPLYVLVNGARIIYWDGRQPSLGLNIQTVEFRSANEEQVVVTYRLVPLAK